MVGVSFKDCTTVYGSSVTTSNVCATPNDDENTCNVSVSEPQKWAVIYEYVYKCLCVLAVAQIT
jgi:hypothetical protein